VQRRHSSFQHRPREISPRALAVSGRYIYVVNRLSDSLNVFDQGGFETNALTAATAEFGSLSVLGNTILGGNLDIRNSLFVGAGGIFSAGALSVASTNTTSTFMFAVSTTNLEVQTRLTVNGQSVCLSTGTGCPSSLTVWTENTASNTVYLVTSTRDVLIGGNTTATAGFVFDRGSTTSTVMIGNSANANLLVGTSTYGGGLNPAFTLNGDDVFVQGQIGSLEGLFSATGVTVGLGTTVYGDGNLYKTNAGDFTFALGNATNSFRFYNGSRESLTVASSGNIGIGVTTPLSALDVSGTIQAILRPGSSFPLVARLGTDNGGLSAASISGNTIYAVIDTLSGTTTLEVFDVPYPTAASSVAIVTVPGMLSKIAVVGRYLYAASGTMMVVYDVSNMESPSIVGSVEIGSGMGTITDLKVSGNRVLLTGTGTTQNFVIVDATIPTAPRVAQSLDLGSSLQRVAIQGRFAYITGNTNSLHVVDISNSATSSQVGTLTIGTTLEGVAVQGRYAYLADFGADALRVVDISSSTQPVSLGSVSVGDEPSTVVVAGRYAYVSNIASETFSAIDISSSTAPALMGSRATENGPDDLFLIGRTLYVANIDGGSLTGYDIRGTEVSGLTAANAEIGSLFVQSDATIYNQLNVGRQLTVGIGGITSQGGIFAAATSIFANIIPASSSAFDLGAASTSWRNLYASGTVFASNLEVASSVNALHSSNESHPILGTGVAADAPEDVVVQGRFAYVINSGTSDTFMVMDVSDPTSPTPVGSVALSDAPTRLFVRGRYAYIAHVQDRRYSIVDISIPTAPVVVANPQLPTVSGVPIPRDVYVRGLYLYVLSDDGLGGTLRTIDVTDPSAPTYLRSMSFSSTTANPIAMTGQGRYLYIANNGIAGFTVVDLLQPAQPVEAVTTNDTGVTGNGSQDVAVQGGYAFVSRSSRIDVYNISSATGTYLATTTAMSGLNAGALFLNGRYLYAGDTAASRVSVIDVSSSTSPTRVNSIPTGGQPGGVYVGGRYLYTAGTDTDTVSVISLPGAEVAGLLAASAELGSLSVLTNASVQGQFTVSGDLSVGSGGILSQGLLGVFTSSTFATSTSSQTLLQTRMRSSKSLVDVTTETSLGTSRLVSVGNMTDTRKFMVTCGGNVYADGTFSSPATDFAEYFSSDGSLTVGDVLVLDPNGTPSNPSVLKSSSSASSRARTLGVFSTKPSFVGGYTEGIESGASSTHVPVALLGRVPTKALPSMEPFSQVINSWSLPMERR
jgi:hypothetical protein